jgi:hypothetical protein
VYFNGGTMTHTIAERKNDRSQKNDLKMEEYRYNGMMDGQIKGCINGMDGQMGWIDRWMDKWMDG